MAGYPAPRYCHHVRQVAHEAKGEVVRMVKVSIRVQSGATRFDVAVVTVSAEQAVRLVRGRYLTSDVRVKAPTGPEGLLQRAALAA